MPESTVIADITFTKPTFSYAEHVAQASYDVSGQAQLIVRKAEGTHTAQVTDRATSEFAQSWKNTYEGFEVTSYGDTQNAAAICTWKDGSKEYGVTIEGHGSNKVAMDSEDIGDIVKAVKNAENPQAASTTQQTQTQQTQGNTLGFDAYSFAWNNGLGELQRYYYVQGADGKYYWAVVTRGSDGNEYTTYADAAGAVVQGGVEVASNPDYDGADFNVEQLVQNNGLGQYRHYYWIQGENGQGYWGIVTIGADGQEHTTYTDEQGNIIQGGVEIGSQPDANAAAYADGQNGTAQGTAQDGTAQGTAQDATQNGAAQNGTAQGTNGAQSQQ
ncbi:MAG TPA: hypothetical protein DCP91_03415 [Eggerthellaceae bacterium]|nr:hypothetical protein [Eggerthellaceae bacterium]